jgi:hypothetical protein
MRASVAVLLLLAACSTPSHAEPASRPAGHLVEGRYYVEPGAPDPLACTEDKQCIGDTVTDAGGCCIRSSEAFPQTWPWHTWLSERRMSAACKSVKCPALPPPEPPPDCAFETRCDKGRCRNSCK